MKRLGLILIQISLFLVVMLLLTRCIKIIDLNDIPGYSNTIAVKDTVKIKPDTGITDPRTANYDLASCSFTEQPESEIIIISNEIPESFDLSRDMPPVKSQGNVGSCASFATAYYMKSYQEKIQYGYQYENFEKVMSPSYLYNQVKISSDCNSGSCFQSNLEKLKKEGVSSWKVFPYDGVTCSTQPNPQQKQLATSNKIKSFYGINYYDSNSDFNLIKTLKTLIINKTPILYASAVDKDFAKGGKNEDSIYVCRSYNLGKKYGNHGMVIVGFDDRLNAFKLVNSWGTSWGNGGYAYLDYSFFDPKNLNMNYTVLGLYYSKDL